MASIDWTKNLPAVALVVCGVLLCNGQAQLAAENTDALKEITDFDDETQYPDLDWIEGDNAVFMNPEPELSFVPLQYVKRRKNQVFSAGLFGKRSGWNQGHQNGLFGKRSDWLDEFMSGGEDDDADNADSSSQYAKKQWNPNQQIGLFGKRNDQFARRTYGDMLQSLHDRVESAMDKRKAAAANLGRVRTKSSGQHVFRTGGLFGKRSVEDPGMQRALWPEEEQRRK